MDFCFSLYRAYVTHVINPSSFWMQIGTETDFQEFEEYQKTLDKFYNEVGRKNNVNAEDLSQGDVVMVADTEQEELDKVFYDDHDTSFHWKRTRIARVVDNRVDVFYIDIGNTEIIRTMQVKSINQHLFDYLPPQVYRFGLAGLKPVDESWSNQAITFFEAKVLKTDIVASLVEYDESQAYGKVLIYIRGEDNNWYSLAKEILEANLALPTELYFDEPLSDEMVKTALERKETLQKMFSLPEETNETKEDNIAASHNSSATTNELCRSDCKVLQSEKTTSTQPHHHLPSSTDIFLGSASSSSIPGSTGTPVNVPKLNVSAFLKKKMEEERSILSEAEVVKNPRNEEDEDDQYASDLDWGKSDLQIGQEGAFDDIDNDISREIHRHFSSRSKSQLPSYFYHRKVRSIPELQQKTDTNVSSKRQGNKLKPLTEKEAYDIEKKIEEILSKYNEDIDLIYVLVTSLVEPEVKVPADRLTAVCSAVLDFMIHDPCQDPAITLSILDAYSVTSAFGGVIHSVVQSLKDQYLRLTESKRYRGYHRSFAKMLAMLFTHAENWSAKICSVIQEQAVTYLEHWTIFNKQRKQGQDTVLDLELLYLECVETFINSTLEFLTQKFPERYEDIREELRQKLLHDQTNRAVRIQLLDTLLKLYNTKYAMVDVAVQTSAEQTDSLADKSKHSSHTTIMREPRDLASSSTQNNQSKEKREHKRGFPKSLLNLPPRLQKRFFKPQNSSHDKLALLMKKDNGCGSARISELVKLNFNASEFLPQTGTKFELKKLNQVSLACSNVSVPLTVETMAIDTSAEKNVQCSPSKAQEAHVLDIHSSTDSDTGDRLFDKGAVLHNVCNDNEETAKLFVLSNARDIVVPSFFIPEEFLEEPPAKCLQISNMGEKTKSLIKYTPEFLKSLNPKFTNQNLKFQTVEPCELNFLFDTTKEKLNGEHMKETNTSFQPPLQKYTGQGDTQLEVTVDPGSKFSKWKNLSELLPETQKHKDTSSFSTSLDPQSSAHKYTVVENESSSTSGKSGTLRDLAKDLLSSVAFETDLPESNVHSVQKEAEPLAEQDNVLLTDKNDTVPRWNKTFFKGVSPQVEDSKTKSGPENTSKKGKKKKIKFRPLDKYLDELQLNSSADINDPDFDEFSPEALEMYEELDRQESLGKQGSDQILPQRLRIHEVKCSHSGSTHLNNPWVPGKRRCTRCGKEDHLVYDCEEEVTIHVDKDYLF